MTAPTKTAAASDDDNGRKTPVGGIEPKPQADVEVGVSNFLPWQTPYQNAWEALRDDDVTVRELVAMRRTDGQARASVPADHPADPGRVEDGHVRARRRTSTAATTRPSSSSRCSNCRPPAGG
jgi:hypothetical protein